MNNDMRGPELVRDDALTTESRALYAAPSDEAYWTTLEHRVMAALDEEESWYTVSERWLRAGLVAAASFASLVTFHLKTFRAFGMLTAFGIISALVLELTFIPALRSLLRPPAVAVSVRDGLDRLLARLAAVAA